jgi:signal transduction histidine kinase
VIAGRTRAPWIVLALSVLFFVGTMVLTVVNGSFRKDSTFILLAIVMIIGYTTVGALIASRRVGGPIGWFMMSVGLGFLLAAGTSEYAIYAFRTNPGGLPFGTAAAVLNALVWIPTIVPLILVLLLFPTGSVPSPRWRFLPWAIVALSALGLVGSILHTGELDIGEGIHVENPTGVASLSSLAGAMAWIAGLGLIVAAVASVGALVLRFRRAHGDERQQIRWLAYVAAVGLVFFILASITSIGLRPNETRLVSDVFFYAFFASVGLGVPAAAGVAMLRYRLWDLDLVVRKTVIFGLLVGIITLLAVVVAVVVPVLVLGTGLSSWERALFVLGVCIGLATGLLRRWARRTADRLVYGGRATPYEVLTEFSGRLAETYSTDDVVPRMAAIVGSGIGARAVTVWLRVGREPRPVASWPPGIGPTGEDASWFEVRHQGEPLGAITISMPANDPMTPDKERLVHDLAAQAGLLLRNVRLIEELRESRRRIVAAQDERARKLERNIHDGAQQQLVALAVKLRLADSMIARDPAKAREMIAQIQGETQEALDALRDLARGIYPPLLADKGLTAALRAQASKSAMRVDVSGEGVGRYGEDIEAAVYFCALEALQNSAKYASASHVEIALDGDAHRLTFEIGDDGIGFDPRTVTRGTGLHGMADRIDAIGGTLVIESGPGRGTRIAGSIPLGTDQPVAAEPVAATQADSSRSGPKTALGM